MSYVTGRKKLSNYQNKTSEYLQNKPSLSTYYNFSANWRKRVEFQKTNILCNLNITFKTEPPSSVISKADIKIPLSIDEV